MAKTLDQVRRIRIGQAGTTTYWFVDVPAHPLLKEAGESYYDRMMAPVPPRWVLRFDVPVFERMGAQWFLPLVERLASGHPVSFEEAIEAVRQGRPEEEPAIDAIDWTE